MPVGKRGEPNIRRIDIEPGARYGWWTVLFSDGVWSLIDRHRTYVCQCRHCGILQRIQARYLLSGRSKMCEWCRRELCKTRCIPAMRAAKAARNNVQG